MLKEKRLPCGDNNSKKSTPLNLRKTTDSIFEDFQQDDPIIGTTISRLFQRNLKQQRVNMSEAMICNRKPPSLTIFSKSHS